jgi:hypothetical protein
MGVTLEIQRASYGTLLLQDADKTACRFFAEDISSRDPDHSSFDDLAISGIAPRYNKADTTAIRRGMRLNRAPHHLWNWVREQAPVALLAALPPDLDLVEANDDQFADTMRALKLPWRAKA